MPAAPKQVVPFDKVRDVAARLGLMPQEHATGGQQRLGCTSKHDNWSIRTLLQLGRFRESTPRDAGKHSRSVAEGSGLPAGHHNVRRSASWTCRAACAELITPP